MNDGKPDISISLKIATSMGRILKGTGYAFFNVVQDPKTGECRFQTNGSTKSLPKVLREIADDLENDSVKLYEQEVN